MNGISLLSCGLLINVRSGREISRAKADPEDVLADYCTGTANCSACTTSTDVSE
jgi:hypothetical protein